MTGIQKEDKLYKAQAVWIKRRFGVDAMNKANYGWYVDATTKEGSIICTKVYGHGILTTHNPRGDVTKINHKFEEF